MQLNEYQVLAATTAIYPREHAVAYCTLGLTNEAGEVAGVLKKHYRGDYDYSTCRDKLSKELGDVLWYVANLARECGLTLDEVAQANVEKLKDRQARGVLQGNGDNR